MPINFDEARRAKLDALAAQVFVQLRMVGLVYKNLPKIAPQLHRKEIAKRSLLAGTLEAVFGMTASYGREEI